MVCPTCGARVEPGSRYCLSCGTLLSSDTQAAAPVNPPAPWTPYPGLNNPTTPPTSQPQGYPFAPFQEQPVADHHEGATWPGTQPPYASGGSIPSGSPGRSGSGWQTVASILAVGVVLIGMLFVWLSRGQHSTASANATTTTHTVIATVTAPATPVPSACQRLSDFIGAGRATVTPMFPQDVPFPTASLSYLGNTSHDGPYTFYFVRVCSSGLTADGARAFFSQALPSAGWAQSPSFPYHGNPTSDCGDPYCWQSSGSPARYISLEQAQNVGNGAASTYLLRLGEYDG